MAARRGPGAAVQQNRRAEPVRKLGARRGRRGALEFSAQLDVLIAGAPHRRSGLAGKSS